MGRVIFHDYRPSSKTYHQVQVHDEPGAGGACHEYEILAGGVDEDDHAKKPSTSFGMLYFQNGPLQDGGANGIHGEDLIAILIHRLECFQAGQYACRENALALTKLQEAQHWLTHRTLAREERGVEGTHEV